MKERLSMSERVGKIIRIRNKFPGPQTIAVNTVGEGLRKHINMCFACSRFSPSDPNHCTIAQEHFEFCKTNTIATAIVRCAQFRERVGVCVQESSGDIND